MHFCFIQNTDKPCIVSIVHLRGYLLNKNIDVDINYKIFYYDSFRTKWI